MPIMNSVIAGGGASVQQPFVTKQIANVNGVNVLVGGNAPIIDLTGVQEISSYGLYQAYSCLASYGITLPSFPANTVVDWSSFTKIGESALSSCFRGRGGLKKLTVCAENCSVGNSALSSIAFDCPDLEEFVMNATDLGSTNSGSMCSNCSSLKTVKMEHLKYIGSSSYYSGIAKSFTGTAIEEFVLPELLSANGLNALQEVCKDCLLLKKASFPKLKTISVSGSWGSYYYGVFYRAFMNDVLLEEINFDSLETVTHGYSGTTSKAIFFEAFKGCSSLKTIQFKSLKTMQYDRYFVYAFDGSGVEDIWFYAVTPTTFSARQGAQFDLMLTNCNGVTVHFPMSVQSTIGSSTVITGGMGGTNTTVLFDLVQTLTGADTNTYTRSEKDSTATATAWTYSNTLYYTSGVSNHTAGVNEAEVGDTIYSDAACTTAVTTISAIA